MITSTTRALHHTFLFFLFWVQVIAAAGCKRDGEERRYRANRYASIADGGDLHPRPRSEVDASACKDGKASAIETSEPEKPRPFKEPTAPDQAQSIRKDLARYARSWRALSSLRDELRRSLREVADLKSKDHVEVGTHIESKVLPRFRLLVARLSAIRPKTSALGKVHANLVLAYRRMLSAYSLAGRAWQASGQTLSLALNRLKKTRTELHSARRALMQMTEKHGVILESNGRRSKERRRNRQ